jgi:chitodextrinase
MKLQFPKLCLIVLLFSLGLSAQNNQQKTASFIGTATSVEYVSSMMSRPQDLTAVNNEPREAKDKRSISNQIVSGKDPQTNDDYFVLNRNQLEQSANRAPASLVFDTYTSNSQPTDPSLAVGPNHVMVVYNTGFMIYDKAGNQLQGQTAPNPAIFPSGGCCDLTASYDNAANRWVLTFLGNGAQIAVSDGPNPLTAGWYVYTIAAIQDYQKLSIWSDGYYITENTSGSNKVWALERSAMLAGNPGAKVLGFNLPGIVTSGFFSPQVLNVTDNNLPAPGGATVVYLQDNAWSGVSTDHIKVWTIDVDWNTTSNSTISSAQQIDTTPFISVFDNGSFSNLTQPNGGSAIDALQATIMNQAQFRKFGSYNSAIFNFVVDADASAAERAAVRWMEFRQSGDNQPWSMYQEGTYTAPDGRHAWNASLAMDGQGNIGMGYTSMSGSTSSSTVRVSSYFTGRSASDPLGTMTSSEQLIANGNGNFSGTRYGDYSKIDVDPSDDSSFWFITEYINNSRRGVVGKFQIEVGPPDTEAPSSPTNLVASAITSNAASLNWNASTDNVSVAQYTVSIDGVVVGTTGNTNFDLTGLSPLTAYDATVNAQDAAGNSSGDAATSFTTINGPAVDYCDSASTNVNDEFISNVQLNTINNSSGAQFYSDFSAISTDLSEDDTYTLTVTPTWTGTVYPEGYAAWIDYNNDGDFDDAGELIWSKAPSSGTPNTGTFTVPSGTSGDAVRLRVSMKYNGIPTSCETFVYGEVEDYTVVLSTAPVGDTQAPSAPLNLVASNETTTTVDLNWGASTDNVGVDGYELFLDGSSIGTVANTSATVTGLLENTSYVFTVRAFDAAGNTSALSNAVNASTTGGGGPGVIAGYYFENGRQGWSDPGSDCRRFNNASYAFEGNFSIRLRDDSSTSNTVSPVLDLSGNNQVSFEFNYYPRSMENGEDFFIEFFNGSSYEVIGQYIRGVDFNNNTFYNETIVLDASSYNFNASNRFRIRNDASGNGDFVYFDQIIVSGDNVVARQPNPSVIDTAENVEDFTRANTGNISLYPNPAAAVLNIDVIGDSFDQVNVYSVTGTLIKTISVVSNKMSVDVSSLSTGVYFVRFSSNGFVITKRFVKK